MTLDPNTPLHEVISWLHERIEQGVKCPACEQHVQLYKNRQITGRMVRDLFSFYHEVGVDNWGHLPPHDSSKEASKLAYWGLIEERPGFRDDGARHAGWWKIPQKGVDFLHNRIAVPKRAICFNGEVIRLDDSEMVTVIDTLGKKFNYSELMSGASHG